ncbi:MAG: glycosyltransferase family 2 protein [Candidatus Bathyarchaeia archaeon]
MITILTPAFNRAHLLPRLAESLLSQTLQDFEWLIVDDGSSDNTEEVINKYRDVANFEVRYKKKRNEGKHSALNVGFNESKGDWIFIVDSDDWLRSDCIGKIREVSNNLDSSFGAVSFLRVFEGGAVIGDTFPPGLKTYIDRIERRVSGDKADVLRKSAIIDFKFPVYSGEKFMAESPMFIYVGQRYKTKFINYLGYVCEYQSGGLSDNSILNRHKCVESSLYVYSEQYKNLKSKELKRRAAINWWRFRIGKRVREAAGNIPLYYLPIGIMFLFNDFFRFGVNIFGRVNKNI